MAWNPNEKGNYAWLSKTASEKGGVEQFVKSKYLEGCAVGLIIGLIPFIVKCVIDHLNKRAEKKQVDMEHPQESGTVSQYMCEDDDDCLPDDSDSDEK